MYICPRCDYTTNKKPCMRSHFKRKNKCDQVKDDVCIDECLKMLERGVLKIKKEKIEHKCKYCEKIFDRFLRLKKHNEMCNEKENLFITLQKQISNLEKKLESQGNTTNNNYNNCGNVTNNITIQAFKDTDYTLLKDEIISCLEDKGDVPMFEQLVDKIHFNKDKPENHNIYKPNVRDDRLMTFNGEDFIVDNKALDTILTKLEEIIEKHAKEDKETGKKYLKKLKTHLKLKKNDDEYIEQTKEDMSVGLYNGRKMVLKTHKSNKE